MSTLEEIIAFGHENVLCSHKTTIEITKDDYLTLKGNCILAIKARKACIDIDPLLRNEIKEGKKIKVRFSIEDNFYDEFIGYGHKDLALTHKSDVVFRKSNFKCDRTILINCTKSSADLNDKLIKKMKDPNTKLTISFHGCE